MIDVYKNPSYPEQLFVKEAVFYLFATRTKKLVQDQRKALRTGDKKQIAEVKKRERALLDWVTQYEAARLNLLSSPSSKTQIISHHECTT